MKYENWNIKLMLFGVGIVPKECYCENEIKCAADGCCGSRASSVPCKMFKGIDASKCRLLNHPSKRRNKKVKSSVASNHYRSIQLLLILMICSIVSV